ncbi:MAG: hypothetical protein JW742_03790 [Candidatus Aminicenantes bacterium]|nr:hypothetical protein [Candidatus Aminicenantes bacterium]
MTIGAYAILIFFGLFVLLLVINPKLSCFGRMIRSPFYPLTRKRRAPSEPAKTTDFGFHLSPDGKPVSRPSAKPSGTKPAGAKPSGASPPPPKTEDYGFHLD